LRFILTQHDRDSDLLKSFISTLNCGRYIAKSGYGEFIVEKFTDVSDKVIPIFEEFKLHPPGQRCSCLLRCPGGWYKIKEL